MRILITTEPASLPINRRVVPSLIRKALRAVARREGWSGDLSVAIVTDQIIHSLNARFLAHDEPTDVLAFLYDEKTPCGADDVAGEIIVSAETAARVAASLDETPERELLRYCIHGLLHICGYDDRTPEERARMEERQERYLNETSTR